MKKTLILLGCCAVLTACDNSNDTQATDGEKYYESPDNDSADAADLNATFRQSEVDTNVTNIGTDRSVVAASSSETYALGEKLIAQSDCLACHRVDTKLVGPSYEEVAQKYDFNDKNVAYLAGKIIEGGSGVWGQVPMTPHPGISEKDAQEMAKYILSLKN
ncbi:MAG: c-type cytochrome [Hymenobacteraceae bacterium]|nr:c-type cytochrome [Hymenobacteraceae bacterium]